MNNPKLSKKQLSGLYEQLLDTARTCEDKEFGKSEKESLIQKRFSLSSTTGKQLYKSLSDEQLIQLIRDIAGELGHSPAQKEVFWVLREYIKLRFLKWPYALKAAGLDKAAGKGGKTLEQVQEEKQRCEKMLGIIRNKAKELGRIPHPKDLPDICTEMQKYANTWPDVITMAGLDGDFFAKYAVHMIDNLEEEYVLYLQQISAQAQLLGRAPLRNEVDALIKEKLILRCKTWRNVLYQIGLEPVTKIKPFSSTYIDHRRSSVKKHHRNTLYDCYYKVLNLDTQSKNDLLYIQKLTRQLHHVPEKNEVPAPIRRRLQKTCGSWTNTLYQIGLTSKKSNN